MASSIKIGQREIGAGNPALIVAEIGLNHNGDLDLGLEMIRAAAEAGADAVKFQALHAHTLVSRDIPKSGDQSKKIRADDSVFSMFQRMELSIEQFRRLKEAAESLGLVFFASSFDAESTEMLAQLGCPVYKVASGDLTHLPLIRLMASQGKPVILSVGMGTLTEIDEAVQAVAAEGNRQVILLQCVSNYPAKVADYHLRKMQRMRDVFEVPVGLSDNIPSLWLAAVAADLRQYVIERHFTSDKNLPGPDQAMSADPQDMRLIVEGVREAEEALGSPHIGPTASEQEGRVLFRRGLVAATEIPAGTTLTEEMIAIKRPAAGIAPKHLDVVVGRTTRTALSADEPITWDAV